MKETSNFREEPFAAADEPFAAAEGPFAAAEEPFAVRLGTVLRSV